LLPVERPRTFAQELHLESIRSPGPSQILRAVRTATHATTRAVASIVNSRQQAMNVACCRPSVGFATRLVALVDLRRGCCWLSFRVVRDGASASAFGPGKSTNDMQTESPGIWAMGAKLTHIDEPIPDTQRGFTTVRAPGTSVTSASGRTTIGPSPPRGELARRGRHVAPRHQRRPPLVAHNVGPLQPRGPNQSLAFTCP
jgi:hypothetical protein